MAQEFIFTGETPARFNFRVLQEAVHAVEPDVVLEFTEQINWNEFPYGDDHPDYPADPDQPWVEESTLTFRNVPDQYTRAQVRNFILNHIPTETTQEERDRMVIERLDAKLNDSAVITDILNRLAALENV